jgi:DNA-binding NarL/FixJ family response regulator
VRVRGLQGAGNALGAITIRDLACRSEMLEILLADDHELVRTGLRLVLETNPGWHVCAEASDGAESVALAARCRPQIAIVDLNMPIKNGLDAIREIRQVSPQTSIIALTADDSGTASSDARQAGARSFVLKTEQAAALVTAVRAIVDADPVASAAATPPPVASRLSRSAVTPLPGARSSKLTERELQIARLLAEGKSNWVVGRILGISMKTVETHRANIMRKLGLGSVVELVHYAVKNQLVSL